MNVKLKVEINPQFFAIKIGKVVELTLSYFS